MANGNFQWHIMLCEHSCWGHGKWADTWLRRGFISGGSIVISPTSDPCLSIAHFGFVEVLAAEWQQDQESLVCRGFNCRHQHFFHVRRPCCTVKVNTKLTQYGGENYWQLRTAKIVNSKICIHATVYKIDSQWKFAVWLGELKVGLCNNLKG